jgi:hypothetical protein
MQEAKNEIMTLDKYIERFDDFKSLKAAKRCLKQMMKPRNYIVGAPSLNRRVMFRSNDIHCFMLGCHIAERDFGLARCYIEKLEEEGPLYKYDEKELFEKYPIKNKAAKREWIY